MQLIDSLSKKINFDIFHDKINLVLERTPRISFLLILFSIYYLDFIPNTNEENYLLLAKTFVNPGWINDPLLTSEYPGTRLLYQYIIGSVIKFFSFELVTVLFRTIFIVLFSLVLNKIYKLLNICNICIFIHLGLLFINNQSLFAGSWMFISIEAKGFAYVFVLLALYYLLRSNIYASILLLIVATYFHILVGFYSFIFFFLTIISLKKFLGKEFFREFLKLFVYLIAILPFIFYLKNSTQSELLYPSADWIYTYFRNPHHTALFQSRSYFFDSHFEGILLSFLGLCFMIYLRLNHEHSDKEKVLSNFTILSISAVLLLVPVAYFDKEGILLKYYIYRINTVSTFVLSLFIAYWIYKVFRERYKNLLNFSVLSLLLYAIIPFLILRANSTIDYISNQPLEKVCSYIKENTGKNDVILSLIDNGVNKNLNIIRKTERSNFVSYKFVPADMSKIHEWYFRVLAKRKVEENIGALQDISKEYKIDYVLAAKRFDTPYLDLIYEDDYYLYKYLSK